MRIAKGIKEADALVEELANFQVKINAGGHDTYGAVVGCMMTLCCLWLWGHGWEQDGRARAAGISYRGCIGVCLFAFSITYVMGDNSNPSPATIFMCYSNVYGNRAVHIGACFCIKKEGRGVFTLRPSYHPATASTATLRNPIPSSAASIPARPQTCAIGSFAVSSRRLSVSVS